MNASRNPIKPPMTGPELLDMYYLEIRCNLLEAAASMDRIERSANGEKAMQDNRMKKLVQALDVLKSPGQDRAVRFLELLST